MSSLTLIGYMLLYLLLVGAFYWLGYQKGYQDAWPEYFKEGRDYERKGGIERHNKD